MLQNSQDPNLVQRPRGNSSCPTSRYTWKLASVKRWGVCPWGMDIIVFQYQYVFCCLKQLFCVLPSLCLSWDWLALPLDSFNVAFVSSYCWGSLGHYYQPLETKSLKKGSWVLGKGHLALSRLREGDWICVDWSGIGPGRNLLTGFLSTEFPLGVLPWRAHSSHYHSHQQHRENREEDQSHG